LIRVLRLAALAAPMFLAACGNLQAVKVAAVHPSVVGQPVAISDTRPTKEEVAPRAFEVPGKSLYVSQTSGGSLAVGLLLGPIGVLANGANIDRITNETGRSGLQSSLYQIDAKAESTAAIGDAVSRLPRPAGVAGVALKPYLIYSVASEKEGIDVLVKIRAESDVVIAGKTTPWVGNYALYLRDVLPYSTLSTPMAAEADAKFRADIRAAYVELLGEITKDLTPGPLPKRDIAWVKSRVLGIGMPGDIERNPQGHLVLRNGWGDNGTIYNAVVFQDDTQFSYDNGPVARQTSGS